MPTPSLVRLKIQPLISLGRPVPGEILLHGLSAHGCDMGRSIEVGRKRPAHGVGDGGGVEIVECETSTHASAFVVVLHGVHQTAGGAHNG